MLQQELQPVDIMYVVVRPFGRVVPIPSHPTRLGLMSDTDDAGQIWDWKRRSLVADLPHWTGQCTSN